MAQNAAAEAADQTTEGAAETAGQDAARAGEEEPGSNPNCGGQSFTGTTKVVLADGKKQAISTLKTGQKVLGTDHQDRKNKAETITAVMVRDDHDLYDLTVRAGGRTAVIDTTRGHLFWAPSLNKWLPTSNLKPGEHLKTPTAPWPSPTVAPRLRSTTGGCGTSPSPATTTTTSTY